ncbi:helix-turn-helix domain-containing protein [Mucilaginibacter achroorhodeus]|uniref:Helix-turn-helix domain-containing protein n=1 Tax=Mucilaginibacter achroorhodeus TaxID=2599294 RepID=A0A563U661_9SPHI|nr:helix-turn-helix domain-containing protein [Mucilaginibacter achroorhodeus]TWR26832.1 helix-turn-helix domain-containing protein [Mucilaginibacter achroorhodeus]
MNVELVTNEDLRQFKADLLMEIRQLMLQPGTQEKKWLKGIEVRQVLGISAGTLQNLRLNGTLTFSKIGGTLYYKSMDIEKLLEGKR